MKRAVFVIGLAMAVLLATVLVYADDMSPEEYRIQSWHDDFEAPAYWNDVWSPGWFRWRTWVEQRHPSRHHKYNSWKYWRSRYYINYRMMHDQAFDPYMQAWMTTPETEWPADRGYVFPATYGRTFLRNISDIWEIETN